MSCRNKKNRQSAGMSKKPNDQDISKLPLGKQGLVKFLREHDTEFKSVKDMHKCIRGENGYFITNADFPVMDMEVNNSAAFLNGLKKFSFCTVCGKSEDEGEKFLKYCGKCVAAGGKKGDYLYCSKDCQTLDWKEHKKVCGQTQF